MTISLVKTHIFVILQHFYSMINQHPFNFIAEIRTEEKERLRQVLLLINNHLVKNVLLDFSRTSTIHFARFLIIDEVVRDNEQIYPAYLVLSTNYDGHLDHHLSEVVNACDFRQLFSACIDYPGDESSLYARINFLRSNSNYKAYFYRGTWGRSVQQIKDEEEARKATEIYLDTHSELRQLSPNEIKHRIAKHLSDIGIMKKYPEVKRPDLLNPVKIIIGCLLLLLVLPFIPLLALIFGIALIVLRRHEKQDSYQDETYSDLLDTQLLQQQEDRIIQNQLTHLVELKPGLFRYLTLRFVLEAIYFLAKYYYNKGKLGNIETIHFARWIIIDKGKRLLFFSNFDGSWESYLSDFTDRASAGLTAVWSNTKGFPRSRFLIYEGAKDEQRFKAWTRRHQIYTDVWYSAYKTLTVKNINNNTEINEALFRKMSDEELKDFLRRY